MNLPSIQLAVDRQDRPIDFTERLWSSAESPWSGFMLERHRVGPAGRLEDFSMPDALLGVCLEGAAELQFGCDKHADRALALPGRFVLLARGDAQRTITWSGMRETLYVSVSEAQIERLMGRSAPRDDPLVVPQQGVDDPQIVRLVLNMYEEVRAGCPAGPLYGESLTIAFASYLLNRYGAHGPVDERTGVTFSRSKAARLRDYIEANLGQDMALIELADLVGLSSHYFSQVFKNTFGATPHRYVLGQRVQEARRLLAAQAASISDVATDLGFVDQSHFTRIFRQVTGMTPKQFQRRLS
ncbi:MAG: helix-turn-helix transcriptional regulator [Proteobacteria bacterium]|nr:helix-turn-helix transcriptional regulator [Pseudomonadota bacterium]